MNADARCYLFCTPPHVVIPDFSATGWQKLPATNTREARSLLQECNVRVGLYYIDANTEVAHLNRFYTEIYFAYPAMHWIALVPEQGIVDPAVRQQIAGWFYDYHTLPVDPERMLFSLGRAYGMARLRQQLQPQESSHRMLGASPVMQQLYAALDRIADSDAPVLIQGESGTGKELVAQAIHTNSRRSSGPMIEVNCGALPRDLVQSELFGHEKGAFTGATRQVAGRLEAADGGTLFLDEVGDLPLELQVNLLRFLQEGVIQRVGSSEPLRLNVRILAATHVDLERAIANNRFREDLYYRLNVLQLNTPPLRERLGDAELLAHHFFKEFRRDAQQRVTGFSPLALTALRAHSWPGNVRELINRVRRAVIMTEDSVIHAADLGLEEQSIPAEATMNLETVRANVERETILRALAGTDQNVSRAAELLGVSRRTLYRMLEKHSITSTTPPQP